MRRIRKLCGTLFSRRMRFRLPMAFWYKLSFGLPGRRQRTGWPRPMLCARQGLWTGIFRPIFPRKRPIHQWPDRWSRPGKSVSDRRPRSYDLSRHRRSVNGAPDARLNRRVMDRGGWPMGSLGAHLRRRSGYPGRCVFSSFITDSQNLARHGPTGHLQNAREGRYRRSRALGVSRTPSRETPRAT